MDIILFSINSISILRILRETDLKMISLEIKLEEMRLSEEDKRALRSLGYLQ